MPRPTPWRLVTLAFAAWAAAFILGYAAVLLDPGGLIARIVIAAAALATIPLFVWVFRRAATMREVLMVHAAVAIAALATAFQALVMFA